MSASGNEYESAIVLNDFHIPHHDLKAVGITLQVVSDIKPKTIFINGDFIDCFMLSRFTKHPKHGVSLAREFELGRRLLSDYRKAAPDSRIVFIYGNHEWRMEKFILDQATALHGLEGISVAEQLHFKEYGIEAVNMNSREQFYQYGKLWIGHFDRVNKHAGYTAKNLIDDKGVSLIQGHTHRMGHSSKKQYDQVIGGWENGCLCTLDPDYTNKPNWQHGFAVVHKHGKSDHFAVTQVHIVQSHKKYMAFYGGKRYEM